MSIVAKIDLTSAFGAIRNQGGRLTCLAFATSDVHGFAHGFSDHLSVEHLFFHAVRRTVNGDPNKAVGLQAICSAVDRDGQAMESGWPYLSKLPANIAEWVPPPTAAPVYKKPAQLKNYTFDEVCANLDCGHPLVLAMSITENFCKGGDNGVVAYSKNDQKADYHAVVAVGHTIHDGKKLIRIRNSWGEKWGDKGYIWLTEDYISSHLVRAIEIV